MSLTCGAQTHRCVQCLGCVHRTHPGVLTPHIPHPRSATAYASNLGCSSSLTLECLDDVLTTLNEKLKDLPSWGSASPYVTCTAGVTWRDILKERSFYEIHSRTGGLGYLMQAEKYENWWCVDTHICAPPGDHFCFVWDEVHRQFVPWGLNSELKLIRTGVPFAAADVPSSRLFIEVAALRQEHHERLSALEAEIQSLKTGGVVIGGGGGGVGSGVEGATWQTDSFGGPCSTTCGEGTRRRTVECVMAGRIVSSAYCYATSRPLEQEICVDYSMCTYFWLPLEWGACSNTCGKSQHIMLTP